jgi:hypothetical protein
MIVADPGSVERYPPSTERLRQRYKLLQGSCTKKCSDPEFAPKRALTPNFRAARTQSMVAVIKAFHAEFSANRRF